jgi:hypothetical protein
MCNNSFAIQPYIFTLHHTLPSREREEKTAVSSNEPERFSKFHFLLLDRLKQVFHYHLNFPIVHVPTAYSYLTLKQKTCYEIIKTNTSEKHLFDSRVSERESFRLLSKQIMC